MCPKTINKALLLEEGIWKFELSWTAVDQSKYSGQRIKVIICFGYFRHFGHPAFKNIKLWSWFAEVFHIITNNIHQFILILHKAAKNFRTYCINKDRTMILSWLIPSLCEDQLKNSQSPIKITLRCLTIFSLDIVFHQHSVCFQKWEQ